MSKQETNRNDSQRRSHGEAADDAQRRMQDKCSSIQQTLTRMQREAGRDPAQLAAFEQTLDDIENRLQQPSKGRTEEIQVNPSSPAGNRNP